MEDPAVEGDHYRERRSGRNTSEGRRRRDGEEEKRGGREGTGGREGGRKRDTREGGGGAPVGPRGRGNEGEEGKKHAPSGIYKLAAVDDEQRVTAAFRCETTEVPGPAPWPRPLVPPPDPAPWPRPPGPAPLSCQRGVTNSTHYLSQVNISHQC
ncbi:unnamed protein product [Arctogadus glacialis]